MRDFLLDIGVPQEKIMPVYHGTTDTIQDVKDWAMEGYKYVALGRDSSVMSSKIFPIYRVLADAGIKIHGQAITNWTMLRRIPFYSAVSTTWAQGQYGMTSDYRLGQIYMVNYDVKDKDVRKHMWRVCEELDLDYQAFINDSPDEVNTVNAYHWARWAEHMMLDRSRDYWEDDKGMVLR